jgi:Secretion system C-terminal sorting domain
MKSMLTIVFLLSVLFKVSGQQLSLETALDATVNETSGLIYLNNTLITHNDSATTNQLFDIDLTTGAVTRTVTITNATNIDWEDITHDDSYIYIGDFGNYQGDRTDLKVYRILISEYFSNLSVSADVINFEYNDQSDFTPSPLATNFDAEGLMHYNNKLYIFTKNWLDGKTNIYELTKTPGTYNISKIDSIEAQGLVTGVTYNSINNSILLCGYDVNSPFLIELNGFNTGLFSNGNVIKTSVNSPTNYSSQIEGITSINASEYYISAEENGSDLSGLFSVNLSTLSDENNALNSLTFYPNPTKDIITISHENCVVKFYSILGKLVKDSSKKRIDVSDLKPGVYLLKILNISTDSSSYKRLVVQ